MTMARSLPRPGPLQTVLPPMPRRQSCDRCHEQKVRCVTEGPESAPTLRDIANETAGGRVVSSVPCVRCKKAGAVCIYSPQLRSGRPRARRDSSAPPPRRRARQVSRCSSSSSLSPVLSPFPSLSSSFRPPAAVDFPSGIGLEILEPPGHDFLDEHAGSQISPLSSSTATTPLQELESQHGAPNFEVPLAAHEWLVPSTASDSGHLLAGMCQLAAFSEPAATPAVSPVPTIFPGPAAATCPPPTAEPAIGGRYPPASPSSGGHLDEELAQLNSRIHAAGRVLVTQVRTLASLSSPAVNDVFDAACALISAVDRYAATRPGTRSPSVEAPPTCIDGALDASVCLLIHACHQALLGVFEDLSTFFLLHLSDNAHQHPHQHRTAPGMGNPRGLSFPASDNRVVIMTNLMSNLLSQLDCAFLSLFSAELELAPPPYEEDNHSPTTLPASVAAPLDSNDHSNAAAAPGLVVDDRYRVGGRSWRWGGGVGGVGCGSLFAAMQARQARVTSRVRAVERLLGQPECTLPV